MKAKSVVGHRAIATTRTGPTFRWILCVGRECLWSIQFCHQLHSTSRTVLLSFLRSVFWNLVEITKSTSQMQSNDLVPNWNFIRNFAANSYFRNRTYTFSDDTSGLPANPMSSTSVLYLRGLKQVPYTIGPGRRTNFVQLQTGFGHKTPHEWGGFWSDHSASPEAPRVLPPFLHEYDLCPKGFAPQASLRELETPSLHQSKWTTTKSVPSCLALLLSWWHECWRVKSHCILCSKLPFFTWTCLRSWEITSNEAHILVQEQTFGVTLASTGSGAGEPVTHEGTTQLQPGWCSRVICVRNLCATPSGQCGIGSLGLMSPHPNVPPCGLCPPGDLSPHDFVSPPPMYGRFYLYKAEHKEPWDQTYATQDFALQLPWALLLIQRIQRDSGTINSDLRVFLILDSFVSDNLLWQTLFVFASPTGHVPQLKIL